MESCCCEQDILVKVKYLFPLEFVDPRGANIYKKFVNTSQYLSGQQRVTQECREGILMISLDQKMSKYCSLNFLKSSLTKIVKMIIWGEFIN